MTLLPSDVCKGRTKPLVLAIGPWNTPEFLIARRTLESDAELSVAQDCKTASEFLSADRDSPDFIVLAQSLPGMFEQAEIERLRLAAPLAEIIVVAGTWCEGEIRTGKPLCGVMRVYWYDLATWWPVRRRQPDWSGGLDGPLSRRHSELAGALPKSPTVAIRTQSYESYEALKSSLAACNVQCIWFRGTTLLPEALAAGIWDGGQLDSEEFRQLVDFARRLQDRGGSLIVLLDFPRKEHYTQLEEVGCQTVFGKPYNTEELAAAIARLT